jgi:hypothetical protein
LKNLDDMNCIADIKNYHAILLRPFVPKGKTLDLYQNFFSTRDPFGVNVPLAGVPSLSNPDKPVPLPSMEASPSKSDIRPSMKLHDLSY